MACGGGECAGSGRDGEAAGGCGSGGSGGCGRGAAADEGRARSGGVAGGVFDAEPAYGELRLEGTFDEVVRRGESGEWGLEEIGAALRPVASVARPVMPVQPVPARPSLPIVPAVPAADAGVGAEAVAAGAGVAGARVIGAAGASGKAASAANTPAAVASRLSDRERQGEGGLAGHLRSPWASDRIVMKAEPEPQRTGLLIAIVVGVLLLAWLGIHFFRAAREGQTRSVVQDTPSAVTVPQQSSENRPPARGSGGSAYPAAAADREAFGGGRAGAGREAGWAIAPGDGGGGIERRGTVARGGVHVQPRGPGAAEGADDPGAASGAEAGGVYAERAGSVPGDAGWMDERGAGFGGACACACGGSAEGRVCAELQGRALGLKFLGGQGWRCRASVTALPAA